MDFNSLMNMASAKQEKKDKIKINRYSSNLPPPKKEIKKEVAQSEVVRKLIQEKENERQTKEKVLREKELVREREEKKSAQFRIPKKPKVDPPAIDTEKLINSLFEDTDDDDDKVTPQVNGHAPSHSDSPSESRLSEASSKNKKESTNHSIKSSDSKGDNKHSTSSSSSSSKHKSSSSSSRESEKSSSKDGHKSGHKSSHSSKSLSEDKKSHSSHHSSSHSKSSSSHSSKSSSASKSHSSSSSKPHSSSSSSSKHSSSSSSKSHPSSSSSKSHSSSSSSSSKHKSKSTSSSLEPSSVSSETQLSKAPSELPVTLSKHHLKPVAERYENSGGQLSERERILAKLQAIRERTKAAIDKEQQGKKRRSRGEGGHRTMKGADGKEDERVKSKEIIKGNDSSDDETSGNANMPSVIDIMLTEHQSKLERGKIARMAKQAWERATKGGDTVEKKKWKERSRLNPSKIKSSKDHRKRKDHSLSPEPGAERKKSRPTEERKKPKLIRHARNAAPPPIDFKAILAMAEKKTKDPPRSLQSIPKKKKKEKEERPMTQEEKERKERIKSKEYQHWLKYGGKHPNHGKENAASSSDSDDNRKKVMKNNKEREQHAAVQPKRDNHNHISGQGKKAPVVSSKHQQADREPSKKPSMDSSRFANRPKQITVNENLLVCGPAEDNDDDDDDSGDNPFDRIYKNVHKKKDKSNAVKRKRLDVESEDEEDEYASDLDDFIDDGDDGTGDYSKHIAKIFGYNKSKYVDEDDDVSDMEANFATVMAEEKRSAKLGRLEDLEDMRMEQEELKRKAMMKKKMRR